jgi:hypothetical protein
VGVAGARRSLACRAAPRAALLAAAAGAAAPGARAELVTIRVVSVSVSIEPKDVKPAGASKGDRIVYRDVLLNAARQFGRAKGARVGSDRVMMTFTSARVVRAQGVVRLPGGTLRVGGRVVAAGGRNIRVAVAGGTGRYRGAAGTLTIGPGETRSLNVYRLRLPGTVA